jgi:hypothetical protein
MPRYYHRTYETASDADNNQHLGDGQTRRARSGSVGIIDGAGNRSLRIHYHAMGGEHTLVREMPDAGPHTFREFRGVTTSRRPMLIPGAVTHGTVTGTKRKY